MKVRERRCTTAMATNGGRECGVNSAVGRRQEIQKGSWSRLRRALKCHAK